MRMMVTIIIVRFVIVIITIIINMVIAIMSSSYSPTSLRHLDPRLHLPERPGGSPGQSLPAEHAFRDLPGQCYPVRALDGWKLILVIGGRVSV